MDLKQYLNEQVPDLNTDSLDNTNDAYEREYAAAHEYFKKYGFTDADRTELHKRGFDPDQEKIWKEAEDPSAFKRSQEIKKWRETIYRPLTECAENIQKHCSEHTTYAKLGCYFEPDVSELAKLYGIDNVRMVVANHVRIHTGPRDGRSFDGRYDNKVRDWAWTVPEIPQCPHSTEKRVFSGIGLGNLHSTLCDSLARKVMEYEKSINLTAPAPTPKKKAKSR